MHKNLGVIIESKPTDFVAGKLPYEVVNPTGDWTSFEPSGENQFSSHADSMACVTFSALNCIETQYKFLTGKEINFSDRFIAKLSGTTSQGNSIQKVLDTIRQYGLVLESDYPTPAGFDWNTYYAEISQSVMDKAILKPVNGVSPISYEFGSTNYSKDLKHCPLQMIIEKTNPYHAVEMVNLTRQFDSYPPYDRPQASIHTVCKIILKLNNNSMNLVNDNGVFYIEGELGKIGIADVGTLEKMQKVTAQVETRASVGPQVGVFKTQSVLVDK